MTARSPLSRRQHAKVLDREIAAALAKAARKMPKTRARPFGRAARRAIAAKISEYVELSSAGRVALELAQEAVDKAEYEAAIGKLAAALPATLWVGYDADRDQGFAQQAEPVWTTEDPAGEDPAAWKQLERAEIARTLVEDA